MRFFVFYLLRFARFEIGVFGFGLRLLSQFAGVLQPLVFLFGGGRFAARLFVALFVVCFGFFLLGFFLLFFLFALCLGLLQLCFPGQLFRFFALLFGPAGMAPAAVVSVGVKATMLMSARVPPAVEVD
jgi:hypothetical protein